MDSSKLTSPRFLHVLSILSATLINLFFNCTLIQARGVCSAARSEHSSLCHELQSCSSTLKHLNSISQSEQENDTRENASQIAAMLKRLQGLVTRIEDEENNENNLNSGVVARSTGEDMIQAFQRRAGGVSSEALQTLENMLN